MHNLVRSQEVGTSSAQQHQRVARCTGHTGHAHALCIVAISRLQRYAAQSAQPVELSHSPLSFARFFSSVSTSCSSMLLSLSGLNVISHACQSMWCDVRCCRVRVVCCVLCCDVRAIRAVVLCMAVLYCTLRCGRVQWGGVQCSELLGLLAWLN